MRLLVCGSRTWRDYDRVRFEIARLSPLVVIHGDARGADRLAGAAALELGIAVEAVPADWARYGRAAGGVRNAAMLAGVGGTGGKVDGVLAFRMAGASPGTDDMIRRARAAGVPVTVIEGA